MSETDEQWHHGLRRKLKRAYRQRRAKLWHYAYRIRYKASQYRLRHGTLIGVVTIMLLMAASAYLLPTLQARLETWFTTEEAIRRVQSLLLNTGSALVGATAIVTSLVLFAMQVNVERLPHGLFRWFSQDRKLLGAFAGAFVLAISVAAVATVTKQSTLAAGLVYAGWAILSILVLFLYAYRRALKLINPVEQLRILRGDTHNDLRRWARRAERARPLLESEEEREVEPSPRDPTPDAARSKFFQINPNWSFGARKSVQHAVSFARRYAEQEDYEVVGAALSAIVEINAAYVLAKGRTFYANSGLLDDPRAPDALVNETLESMRQSVDRAIRRRDERQIEQSMEALAQLVQVYLDIDYGSPIAEKHHAQLAAGYLANTVEAAAAHDMADVLMAGQRLMGRAARHFVGAGSTSDVAEAQRQDSGHFLHGVLKKGLSPRDDGRREGTREPDPASASVAESRRELRARENP